MGQKAKAKPNFLQVLARKVVREAIQQINDQKPEKPISKPLEGTEAFYRDRLAQKLGGKTEISTPVGRIDILTPTEVIEVKRSANWKSAIGQVKSYGQFYPKHHLRIHLFGKLTKTQLETIQSVCNSEQIHLTWE